jgi:hypothetical protein
MEIRRIAIDLSLGTKHQPPQGGHIIGELQIGLAQ